MKKVLVLSCNTGQGHNSAGLAVKEALERQGAFCELRDTLSFARRNTSRTISGGYVGMTTKAPALFGGVYRLGGAVSGLLHKRKSPVYYANRRYAPQLGAYIRAGGFDAVVMPHLFPAEALTYLKKQGLSVPCYAIATDYACIPFWEETEPDFFFLPHGDLKGEFASKGIPEEKLLCWGIPVSARYNQRMEKAEARRRLNLPEGEPVFLVMTGSMGFGDISSFTLDLLLQSPKSSQILILTGRNDALKARIEHDFASDSRVRAVPFTREVPVYMDACDVLLSKPGGLTSTEAAVKNVPLVHTRPIPGCETKNAAFFAARGLSQCSADPKAAAVLAARLAGDEAAKQAMLAAQRTEIPCDSADRIAAFILGNH